MDDLNILITGAGAPGIKGTLYSLKNNFDNRQINTIGTDAREEVNICVISFTKFLKLLILNILQNYFQFVKVNL